MTLPSFLQLGNCFHGLNLASISIYATAMALYGNVEDGLFDAEWLSDGFCMPQRATNYWTTHDLSAYFMMPITLIGLLLWRYFYVPKATTLADNLFFWASIGALGHGAGHLLISHAIRNGFFPSGNISAIDNIKNDHLSLMLLKLGPAYIFFWIPLIRTYMMHASKGRVVFVALMAQMGSMFLPVRFGFSYTQSCLFAGLSLDQLFAVPTEEKNSLEYALWPLLTVLPSTVMAWVESTGCSTHPIMLKGGGHVVYDIFMSSSYILYYIACFLGRRYYVGSAGKLKMV